MGDKKNVVTLEDRIPKLKQQRRQKANRRLILYIAVFFLLMMVIVYFQSPLSNVGSVKVDGNHFVDTNQIIKAGDLTEDSSFWNAGSAAIASKIENIAQIQSASVNKHLPNRVTVNIDEYKRVAYLQTDGKYEPILENGAHLSALDAGQVPVNAPVLVNWQKKEAVEKMAAQIEELPQPVVQSISEINYTPTENFSDGVTVYTNKGFEVRARIKDFADKMKHYPEIVSKLSENSKGVIHMRMSTYFSKYTDQKSSTRE